MRSNVRSSPSDGVSPLTDSFSRRVKDSLIMLKPPKSGCCRVTLRKLSEALDFDDTDCVIEVGGRMLCDECRAVFLRGLFIKFGTVTDPEKSYHLEMSFPNEKLRDFAAEVLSSRGFSPKCGMRRSRFTVYFKNSETIEEFLGFIGASGTAFDMINLKLLREARNDINRANNFETSNIKKSVTAGAQYVAAIKKLKEKGRLDTIPEDLRETAYLRLENDTVSMAELGRLHEVPISKSGVKHRLDRISEMASDLD